MSAQERPSPTAVNMVEHRITFSADIILEWFSVTGAKDVDVQVEAATHRIASLFKAGRYRTSHEPNIIVDDGKGVPCEENLFGSVVKAEMTGSVAWSFNNLNVLFNEVAIL